MEAKIVEETISPPGTFKIVEPIDTLVNNSKKALNTIKPIDALGKNENNKLNRKDQSSKKKSTILINVEQAKTHRSKSKDLKEEKKYKWKIESNQHYMWASHTNGGIMKVDYGSSIIEAPPSAPRKKPREKVYIDDDTENDTTSTTTTVTIHPDGNVVVKEEDVHKALREIENAVTDEQRKAIVSDLKEAEKMEEEGQLYEEDGSCLVRLCRCCCTDILSDEEEEKGKKVNVKNERGVKKTKMLKSVNSWITLPIVESK
eukprot:g5133.t1